MFSYERVLPIGTVVLLKDAKKRGMILGYQRKLANGDDHVYDYCACPFPEGYISPRQTFVFDHSQIDRIIYMGFQNSEEVAFQEKLREIISERESREAEE